jgi:hypothetical protein
MNDRNSLTHGRYSIENPCFHPSCAPCFLPTNLLDLHAVVSLGVQIAMRCKVLGTECGRFLPGFCL